MRAVGILRVATAWLPSFSRLTRDTAAVARTVKAVIVAVSPRLEALLRPTAVWRLPATTKVATSVFVAVPAGLTRLNTGLAGRQPKRWPRDPLSPFGRNGPTDGWARSVVSWQRDRLVLDALPYRVTKNQRLARTNSGQTSSRGLVPAVHIFSGYSRARDCAAIFARCAAFWPSRVNCAYAHYSQTVATNRSHYHFVKLGGRVITGHPSHWRTAGGGLAG